MKKQIKFEDGKQLTLYYRKEILRLEDSLYVILNTSDLKLLFSAIRNHLLGDPKYPHKNKIMEAVSSIETLPIYLQTLQNLVYNDFSHLVALVNIKELEIYQTEMKKAEVFSEAVLLVGQRLCEYLRRWQKLTPEEVLDDPVFTGLWVTPIEAQIYLEARRMEEIKPFFKDKRKYRRHKQI